MNEDTGYRVYVRIRPGRARAEQVFSAVPPKSIKEVRPQSVITYGFDRVFEDHRSNQDIYLSTLRRAVQNCLTKRIHTTILAYGQTGSGKTHTLFAHHEQKETGIIHHIIQDVISHATQRSIPVKCSFMQVYQERVSDLIGEGKVQLRDDAFGKLHFEGLLVSEANSAQQIFNLLRKAHQNKIFGHSYIHSQSSRSHVLCTLEVENTKLNVVDLCGCEVLTYNFDAKQRSETSSINLSLFTLQTVVGDLARGDTKHVAFRNSVLTRLLKSSLIDSSRSQVHMFCCISPEAVHQELSASTLRFGQLAIQVDECHSEPTVPNLSSQKRQQRIISNVIDINNPKMNYESLKLPAPWQVDLLSFQQSRIRVYTLKYQTCAKFNILCLHAYGGGCSGRDFEDYLGFIAAGVPCNIFSVDFPGFGVSTGTKFTSRAEKFHEKEEPLQFMVWLLSSFGFTRTNQVTLLGYDLGGAIALSCALHPSLKKIISSVVAFHPTWTDSMQKLALINLPVLFLWFPIENFHLISAGLKMVKTIKGAILHRFNVGAYSEEKTSGLYSLYSQVVSKSIVEFLSSSIEEEAGSRRGQMVTQTIKFDVSAEEQSLEATRDAVKQCFRLIELKQLGTVGQSLVKGGENKPKHLRLASSLPIFDPSTISWEMLHKAQIIIVVPPHAERIKNWTKLPFFSVGRQIQVKTTIIKNALDAKYLYYFDKGEVGITHLARVNAKQSEQFIKETGCLRVDVKSASGEVVTVEVDLEDTLALNLATEYSRDGQRNFVFEDSVVCKYSSPLLRLKFIEIWFAINPLISQIDLSDLEAYHEIQKKCTKCIYESMDLRHLVHEGIDNARYTGTAVDRLAYFGQGNCHHLASVMAALLLPFGELFGWEVIFRAGSFLKHGRELASNGQPLPSWDGKVKTAVEDHTWLEIVYRPSFAVYVLDPSFGICNAPLEEIYSFAGRMHISGKKPNFALDPELPEKLFAE